MTGDDLITVLAALSHPVRIRAMALLHDNGPVHVSELARMLGISRPLLILHMKKLEAADLVASKMTLSADGKAHNMLSVNPFSITLTPHLLSETSPSLTMPTHKNPNQPKEKP